MNFFLKCLLFIMLLPFSSLHAQETEAPKDKNFIFQGSEQRDYTLYCELFMGRGDACESLLRRLCDRIQNDRKDCATLVAKDCQKANIESQTEEEKSCRNGIHTGNCYGVSAKCGGQERMACLRSSYSERYCGRYRWVACEAEGRNGQGEFKSKSCRQFYNQTMIRWWEDRVNEKLEWSVYGEQNIKAQIDRLTAQRKIMEDKAEAMEKEISSISGKIQDALGTMVDELRKQRENLREGVKKLRVEISEISKKIQEYQHMSGVCSATKN